MKRLLSRLFVIMAMLVGATAVSAAPAQAGSQEIRICIQVGTTPGGTPVFDCFTIVVPDLTANPWPPECLSCPSALLFWNEWEDLDWVDPLGKGLEYLSLGKDEIATSYFLDAAKKLKGAKVELAGTGWLDPKKNKLFPDANPDLVSAGQNLVAGLAELRDPEPQPNIEAFRKGLADIAALYGN